MLWEMLLIELSFTSKYSITDTTHNYLTMIKKLGSTYISDVVVDF